MIKQYLEELQDSFDLRKSLPSGQIYFHHEPAIRTVICRDRTSVQLDRPFSYSQADPGSSCQPVPRVRNAVKRLK
jgi:hypothetical protein